MKVITVSTAYEAKDSNALISTSAMGLSHRVEMEGVLIQMEVISVHVMMAHAEKKVVQIHSVGLIRVTKV